MIVGLTGGIASGKSTVSSIFEEHGLEIVDADKIAKIISSEKKNTDKIAEIFGADILGDNGSILREKLRKKAFENRDLLIKLNAVIHPQVIEYFQNKKRETPQKKVVIFDVPLLFEAHLDILCDKIVVVAVSRETQISRIMKRDGNSSELATKIIESQFPLKYKVEHADIVIENNGTLDELKAKVEEVYRELTDNVR